MTTQSSPNGNTAVTLSRGLINALRSLNVQALGFGSTTINDGIANFAITGGAVDLANTRVEIAHTGGLTLRSGGTEVSLTDFVITNVDGQAILTGAVIVNGELVTRAPLFNVQISDVGTSTRHKRSNLDISAEIQLSAVAADTLNGAFGTTAFTEGFTIGAADVDALFSPRNGNIRENRLPVRDFLGDNDSLFPGETQDVVARGRTRVALDDTLVDALESLDVDISGFGRTRVNGGAVDFLITGGAADLDTTSVEIQHSGGLVLSTQDTEVRLTDFVIDNLSGRAVLTGAVIANDALVARLPLFNLRIGQVDTTERRRFTNLDLNDVDVRLTGGAAGALNQAFDVNAFSAGQSIGSAQVDAFVV